VTSFLTGAPPPNKNPVNEVIKEGGMQKTQVLWQEVFLAASPLPLGGCSAAKNFTSCVQKIPPATQAKV